MKKLESEVRLFKPPHIDSMYEFLFYCMELWKDSNTRAAKVGPPNSLNSYFAPACKYSIISNSYLLLDAVIHTYVVMNGFEADENEAENSVYSKWKNFPYNIEGKSLKKSDIKIIDDIRTLRNDVAHPKVPITRLSKTLPKGKSFEAINSETDKSMGFIDLGFEREFKPVHGFFLVNEVTRLLILARNELQHGEKFIPRNFLRFSADSSKNFGQKWPKDVCVN